MTRRGDPSNPNSAASISELYNGPFPGPGISRESVLKAATINGAKFLRADEQIGSLEVGKLADVIVIEGNSFEVVTSYGTQQWAYGVWHFVDCGPYPCYVTEVPNEELGRNKVLLTMLGGEVVYLEDGVHSTFGRNITPKFPNDDLVSAKMARRIVGGVHGEELDIHARAEVARMRKRQGCGHGHNH
ncbi:hypothetical protein Landi51_13245 [Colletotrichum acutatum]